MLNQYNWLDNLSVVRCMSYWVKGTSTPLCCIQVFPREKSEAVAAHLEVRCILKCLGGWLLLRLVLVCFFLHPYRFQDLWNDLLEFTCIFSKKKTLTKHQTLSTTPTLVQVVDDLMERVAALERQTAGIGKGGVKPSPSAWGRLKRNGFQNLFHFG